MAGSISVHAMSLDTADLQRNRMPLGATVPGFGTAGAAGLSLREAVTTATRNPARVGRIAGRQKGLVPGDRADIVQFRFHEESHQLSIEKTFVSGREVYSSDGGVDRSSGTTHH